MDKNVTRIKVNNQELLKLLDYDVSVEPLWGDKTGREALDGHWSGTFVGYFTNLTLTFGKTTPEEMDHNKQLLEHAKILVTYPLDKSVPSIEKDAPFSEFFYGTAIKSKRKTYGKKYDGFSINLVATDRRDPTWYQ